MYPCPSCGRNTSTITGDQCTDCINRLNPQGPSLEEQTAAPHVEQEETRYDITGGPVEGDGIVDERLADVEERAPDPQLDRPADDAPEGEIDG